MKYHILFGVTALVCSFALGAYADETPRGLQEKLEGNIREMETLIEEMESESDGWALRTTMQKHAKLMDASARLTTSIADSGICEEECVKNITTKDNADICDISEAQHNAQFQLLVVLMRHVIRRQNIIMEKSGLFK